MNINNNLNLGVNAYYGTRQDDKCRVDATWNGSKFVLKEARLKSEILGFSFLSVTGRDTVYGMYAQYAKDSSPGEPKIVVKIQTPQGLEEHCVNVKEVDPKSATEIEMFALCTYADASGQGVKGTSGSWQMLKYHCSNTRGRGAYHTLNRLEEYATVRRDWTKLVRSSVNDCINNGMYRQVMEGNSLLDLFKRVTGKNFD